MAQQRRVSRGWQLIVLGLLAILGGAGAQDAPPPPPPYVCARTDHRAFDAVNTSSSPLSAPVLIPTQAQTCWAFTFEMTLTDVFTAANGTIVRVDAEYRGTLVLAEPNRTCASAWNLSQALAVYGAAFEESAHTLASKPYISAPPMDMTRVCRDTFCAPDNAECLVAGQCPTRCGACSPALYDWALIRTELKSFEQDGPSRCCDETNCAQLHDLFQTDVHAANVVDESDGIPLPPLPPAAYPPSSDIFSGGGTTSPPPGGSATPGASSPVVQTHTSIGVGAAVGIALGGAAVCSALLLLGVFSWRSWTHRQRGGGSSSPHGQPKHPGDTSSAPDLGPGATSAGQLPGDSPSAGSFPLSDAKLDAAQVILAMRSEDAGMGTAAGKGVAPSTSPHAHLKVQLPPVANCFSHSSGLALTPGSQGSFCSLGSASRQQEAVSKGTAVCVLEPGAAGAALADPTGTSENLGTTGAYPSPASEEDWDGAPGGRAQNQGNDVGVQGREVNVRGDRVVPGGRVPADPHVALEVRWEAITVRRVLGCGRAGAVFEARWQGKQVAVKVLDHVEGPAASDALRRQVSIMAQHRHPNLAHVHGWVDGAPYYAIVMDFFRRGTVADLVASPVYEALNEEERLRLALQVAQGLSYLHEQGAPTGPGLVHGNLTTYNLLLSDDAAQVVLSDWGLGEVLDHHQEAPNASPHTPAPAVAFATSSSSPLSPSRSRSAGRGRSELHFLAPEALAAGQAGAGAHTRAADVYALGVVIQEVIAGQQHLECAAEGAAHAMTGAGRRPALTTAGLPGPVAEMVSACWALDPAARPSATAVVHCLHQQLQQVMDSRHDGAQPQ